MQNEIQTGIVCASTVTKHVYKQPHYIKLYLKSAQTQQEDTLVKKVV